jgi:SAM-dependent methyltransferase
MILQIPTFVVCPTCRTDLTFAATTAWCESGHQFPIREGVIDFLKREELPFDWLYRAKRDDHCEAGGNRECVERFLLPRLRAHFGDPRKLRVLDAGCGIGALVEALVEHGIDCYGIDPGSRTEAWSTIPIRDRLYAASGESLPFADQSFDVVISSGVLEHVGEPLPFGAREPARIAYFGELLRVLKPDGFAIVAHPNGAHPIDFWHSGNRSLRLHWPNEAWMPSARDVRRWTSRAEIPATIQFLSPEGYLRFQRVRKYGYGRVLAPAVAALFRLFSMMPVLAATPINPWLVACLRRTSARRSPA